MSIISLAIVSIFLVFIGGTVVLMMTKIRERKEVLEKNLDILQQATEERKKLIEETADLALGLVSGDALEGVEAKLKELQEQIQAEQGRLTITQAELDAIESRLRELEEFEREFEASQIQSSREVDMLRKQDVDIGEKNGEIKERISELQNTIGEFESEIRDENFNNSYGALKEELSETDQKIDEITQVISDLNQEYVGLKHTYDALDIEYAQLYEKHNARAAKMPAKQSEEES